MSLERATVAESMTVTCWGLSAAATGNLLPVTIISSVVVVSAGASCESKRTRGQRRKARRR
jgi:hypothetical protein